MQALSTQHRPSEPARWHLLSLPRSSLGIPSSAPESQSRRHVPSTTTRHALSTRGAFHRQVPHATPCACAQSIPADRHRCSDVSAGSPASDMRSHPASLSARPKPLAGSRRSAWATCRPPTSAAECSPSTPTGCPGLDHHGSGEPLPDQVVGPLAGSSSRVASGQGSFGHFATSTPTTTTARRSGFTPT
jgi:hypothetical protein